MRGSDYSNNFVVPLLVNSTNFVAPGPLRLTVLILLRFWWLTALICCTFEVNSTNFVTFLVVKSIVCTNFVAFLRLTALLLLHF